MFLAFEDFFFTSLFIYSMYSFNFNPVNEVHCICLHLTPFLKVGLGVGGDRTFKTERRKGSNSF